MLRPARNGLATGCKQGDLRKRSQDLFTDCIHPHVWSMVSGCCMTGVVWRHFGALSPAQQLTHQRRAKLPHDEVQ